MKFSRLNESLDWITLGKTAVERAERMLKIVANDSTFVGYMQLAFIPTQKLVGLPEGEPKQYRPKFDMPDEFSESVLKRELRRVKNFLSGGSAQNLIEEKRIALWINILESLHWKEATVLTNIKDQTLGVVYPEVAEVLKVINIDLSAYTPTTIAPTTTTIAPTTQAPLTIEDESVINRTEVITTQHHKGKKHGKE